MLYICILSVILYSLFIKYFKFYIKINSYMRCICTSWAWLEVEHGHKVKLKVLTTLNFLTTPSFSVTTPSCEPRGQMGRWPGIELYLYIIFGVSKYKIRCCEGNAHVPHFGLFFQSRRGKFAYAMLVGPGSDAWCEYRCQRRALGHGL